MYTIEKVSNDDIEDIVRVYNSNKKFLITHMGTDIISKEFILKEIAEMKNIGFVSTVVKDKNKKVIGVCDYKIGKEVYLSLLMIHGDFKKKGIGNKIYKCLEKSFKERGYKYVRIDVVCDYEDNVVGFWKNLGFKEVDKINLKWNNHESDALKMRRCIR